ncbi:hypothetical protein MLD38_023984 [Melastoma candidum]|uniref:Uncharacterized protein n=1 Tax=Melastoma candidum TaxID=119954 RepID=A0ACB9NSG4_9MYRT|nr:hypothetical protein MLD38_023984 [Melastoma candidum]
MKILSLVLLALVPVFGHLVLGRHSRSEHVHGRVTTMVTDDGDVVDCVDIYKQSTLTNPLLSDHVLQRKPSWVNESHSNAQPDGPYKACPENTVPVPRITANPTGNFNSSDQHRVDVALTGQHRWVYYGIGAELNVYDLSVAPGQFSSHNLWVESYINENYSMILVGWRADPYLFQDSKSRLFTYWTGKNFNNGCYNTLCDGYVQVDNVFYPGMVLQPTSIYGGNQYIIRLDVVQDRDTHLWWLMVGNNRPVGYWPKEFLPGLQGGATVLAWGGLARAGGDGICPPLGNGHFPDASNQAMYIRSLQFIDNLNNIRSTSEMILESIVDKSGCYGLNLVPDSAIVYLGGPGGCRC